MVKKKGSKKKDLRGYNTSNQIKAVSTVHKSDVTVSAPSYTKLVNLLEQPQSKAIIDDKKSNLSSNALYSNLQQVSDLEPGKRRKLGNLIEFLSDLKFDVSSQIIPCLASLLGDQAPLSKENALDWLCVNLSIEELPSRFVDVEIKDSVKDSLSSSGLGFEFVSHHDNEAGSFALFRAGVDNEVPKEELIGSSRSNVEKSEQKQTPTVEEELKNEESKEMNKDYILQAYGYESISDDESEDMCYDARDKSSYVGGTICNLDDEYKVSLKSLSLDNLILELEYRLQCDEKLAQDEATLYMMSKIEVNILKKQIQKRKQMLKGHKKKLEKVKHMQKSEKPQTHDNEQSVGINEEVDHDLNFSLDMFSDENTEAESNVVTKSSIELKPRKEYPKIGKGWLGKSPRQLLQEYCRKNKLGTPKFQNFCKGCHVVVLRNKSGTNKIEVQEEGPFDTCADAQNYVACVALYKLDPITPTHLVLPPEYRDVWLEWVLMDRSNRQNEANDIQFVKEREINDIIQNVLNLTVCSQSPVYLGTSIKSQDKKNRSDDKTDVVKLRGISDIPDEWDADEDSSGEYAEEICSLTNTDPTIIGKGMRQHFLSLHEKESYKTMLKFRCQLPMWKFKDHLLDTIQKNSVTILHGETGCGKTTQCAQFLIEQSIAAGLGDKISILCTQPRRISAVSVSERVAEEMGTHIGDLVGYHIRLENKKSKNTRLLFCTTGVVLRRLQDDPDLNGITHVIVDEVHERQWQIDFLLIALRQILSRRRDLKVVLMSATLDASVFQSFFGNAPLISVPGRTYEVASYFLEDLLEATGHVIEEGSICARKDSGTKDQAVFSVGRGEHKTMQTVVYDHEIELSDDFVNYSETTRISLERVNEKVINFDLIEDILSMLLLDNNKKGVLKYPESDNPTRNDIFIDGSTLIFLPGMGEIKILCDRLRISRSFGSSSFEIIPLHSTISSKDQKKAFTKAKPGIRKIIVSTNIAETSITIPDVVCVIDSGLVREVRNSKNASMSTLVTGWCSRASSKQRQGRAGRVQTGICLKLYSSRTYEKLMKDQSMPELQRIPLEEVCLNILASGLATSCASFLQQAPQPPSHNSITSALRTLEEVNAIDVRNSSVEATNKMDVLTPLGCHLSKIPVHVRLGKMLIFGSLFKSIDKALTICAALSTKTLFSMDLGDNGSKVSSARRVFYHNSSDFLTLCNVWEAFQFELSNGNSAASFCKKYFLSFTTLREIADFRLHFLDILYQIGFVDKRFCLVSESDRRQLNHRAIKMCLYNKNGNDDGVIAAVICAGLYPNICRVEKASNEYNSSTPPSLWQDKKRLHFHSTSTNHNKPVLDSDWIVFFEKFKVNNKISLSTTCTIKPFAILLFAPGDHAVKVKHLDREVIVNGWMKLNAAAKTGVLFRELRSRMDALLKDMFDRNGDNKLNDQADDENPLISGIISLLRNE